MIVLSLQGEHQIDQVWFEVEACSQSLEKAALGQEIGHGDLHPGLTCALAGVIEAGQFREVDGCQATFGENTVDQDYPAQTPHMFTRHDLEDALNDLFGL